MVCLSTNGKRALNHTIVKQLILITNAQATKVEFLITYGRYGRGFNAIVTNRSPLLFELKKKQQNQVTLFTLFLCVVVVTHNTFTQLNIPTQDLSSWLV